MRAALLAIAVVIAATGGVLWWLLREPSVVTTGPTTSPTVDPSAEFRRIWHEDSADAGVGRVSGRVMLDAERPAAGARVRVFDHVPEVMELECGVCESTVVSCGDPLTVKQVIDGIRGQRFRVPTLLAETTADEKGAFTFEGIPLDARLVATLGERSCQDSVSASPEESIWMLSEPLSRELIIADATNSPISGAQVFVYEPWEGRLAERAADAHGQLKVSSLDWDTFVFTEAEGMMPAGALLAESSELVLAAPRTLIVHTLMGGQPIEADVSLTLHRQDRVLRAKAGVLRIEQLPVGYLNLKASAEGLAAAEQTIDLVEPVTEVTFELRRGAKVLVTVIAETGEPFDLVTASLSATELESRFQAENGAILESALVPEGEYTLSVDVEGMVGVKRQLDLHPGENTLELVMRPAPKLTGRVLMPDGKPAGQVRIGAFEGDEEVATEFTEEGQFTFELQYPGTFKLVARSLRDGVGELEVKVPGPPVTLTLNPRGVLEVELFDVNGEPLPANLLVRPRDPTQRVSWVSSEEDTKWVGRLAGLKGGTYTLEHELPQRMPIKRDVDIVEGKVTRVTLKADKGVSVSGKVLDVEGKPVDDAMVMMAQRGEPATSDALGNFEREGLAAGEIELWAVHPNRAETKHLKVTAPARDVVLQFSATPWVSGRVVDKHGKPITSFVANLEKVTAADGRFKVQAPSKSLDVEAEGYTSHCLTVAEGEVGDVVLTQADFIEGDVVDTEGKPVGGATVMTSFGQSEVVTDARGRFKIELVLPDEMTELNAARGAFSARAPVKIGSPAHLVMRKGTLVLGRVVDASGKGVTTLVMATSKSTPRPVEIQTDAQGTFQLELARGIWLFSSRSFRTARAVEVTGDRLEVTIGEDSSACGAVLLADKPIEAVWVLSRPPTKDEGPWDVSSSVAGSFELSLSTSSMNVPLRGIPCGRYEIAVAIENLVSSLSVDLRQPGQQVKMPFPLAGVAAEEAEPTAPTTQP
jgi:hypothetical protein